MGGTVSDGIHRGATPCEHPDTYRCRLTCECLCASCWDKRHVGADPEPTPAPVGP